MQLETLKLFCDVAASGSFSKGASMNNITQSMCSQAVSQLEGKIGFLLIDRSHRPWRLTSEGVMFYEGVLKIISDYERLIEETSLLNALNKQKVTVASIYSAGLRHMKDFVNSFKDKYPDISVKLEYFHPDKIFKSLQMGVVDVGIVSFPEEKKGFSFFPWCEEDFVVALNPAHPLTKKKEIKAIDLNDQLYVHFDQELSIRKKIDNFFNLKNIRINTILEFDNIESIKRAVEIGSGIAVLPEPSIDSEVHSGTLIKKKLAANIGFVRPLGIVYSSAGEVSKPLKIFIETLLKNPPVIERSESV